MNKSIPAGNMPLVLEMEPGKYFWCKCGRSTNQPFCDGSHKGTGIEPVSVEIKKERNYSWCMCKGTGREPFCDGSHE